MGGFAGIRPLSRGAAADGPAAGRTVESAGPEAGRRLSLRPIDNAGAGDLLDHWGHRRIVPASGLLLETPGADEDAAGLRDVLEAARKAGPAGLAPGLREDDAVSPLGRRRGVSYGRWTGGPADTLSIEFDLEHATREMRGDGSFRAALERAGKVWSRRSTIPGRPGSAATA